MNRVSELYSYITVASLNLVTRELIDAARLNVVFSLMAKMRAMMTNMEVYPR